MSVEPTPPDILTVGHGRLDRAALGELLANAGVEAVVDIRRFPGSRSNPAAAAGEIERLARDLDVEYRHDSRLGGRRSLTAEEDAASPDTWWRVPAFRAYAGWTRSSEFAEAIDDLVAQAGTRRTAILCSESVWWRCHRRIVADVLTLERGVHVGHLMHDGRIVDHPVSEGARSTPDGEVVWDGT